jgi:macrolide-specific efflux system membrane fusion protein
MTKAAWLPGRRTLFAGVIGLVVGLLVAGIAGWIYVSRQNQQAASGPTTTTRSVAAAVDTIKKSISTTGTLTPADQQDVSFVGGGTVTDVAVTQGQQVTAGQSLGTIDTLSMQQVMAQDNLTLAKAQATLVNDQLALSTAQDALTTAQDGGDDTSAPQAKVDTATQQVAVDQSSITTAQSSADAAGAALNSPTVTSPIDGVVSQVNVTVGKKVTGTGGSANSSNSANSTSTGSGTAGTGQSASGTQAATGTGGGSGGAASAASSSGASSASFVVVGTDSWKVDVTVDSAQIGLLAVGDQAQLVTESSTAGSASPLFGTISSVGLISTSTGSTAGYPVEVAVTGTPAGLHDGAGVTVSLIYEQHANVLTVPSAAIHTENGQSVVYQMNGDQQVSTPVQTGDSDGTSTEITSGLNEGDEVLVTVTTGGAGAGTGRTGTGGQTGTGRGAGGFGGGTGGFGGGAAGFGGGAAGVGGGAPAAPPAGG